MHVMFGFSAACEDHHGSKHEKQPPGSVERSATIARSAKQVSGMLRSNVVSSTSMQHYCYQVLVSAQSGVQGTSMRPLCVQTFEKRTSSQS